MLERIESSNILRVLEGNEEFSLLLKELNVGEYLLPLLCTQTSTHLSMSKCIPVHEWGNNKSEPKKS